MKSIFPLTAGHMLQHELDKVTKSEIREYQQTVYNLTSLKWSKNYKELKKKNVTENTLYKYLVYETPANKFH